MGRVVLNEEQLDKIHILLNRDIPGLADSHFWWTTSRVIAVATLKTKWSLFSDTFRACKDPHAKITIEKTDEVKDEDKKSSNNEITAVVPVFSSLNSADSESKKTLSESTSIEKSSIYASSIINRSGSSSTSLSSSTSSMLDQLNKNADKPVELSNNKNEKLKKANKQLLEVLDAWKELTRTGPYPYQDCPYIHQGIDEFHKVKEDSYEAMLTKYDEDQRRFKLAEGQNKLNEGAYRKQIFAEGEFHNLSKEKVRVEVERNIYFGARKIFGFVKNLLSEGLNARSPLEPIATRIATAIENEEKTMVELEKNLKIERERETDDRLFRATSC